MRSKSKDYLGVVASLGCVVCRNLGYGATPAHVHHIRAEQGISQRASDFLTIPLCPDHHTQGGECVAFHANKNAFERLYGSEMQLLAQTIQEVFENEGK